MYKTVRPSPINMVFLSSKISRAVEWNGLRSATRPYKVVSGSRSGFGPRVTRLGWGRWTTIPGAIWEKWEYIGTRREEWLSRLPSTG